jgi:putative (di)nucleoside polyphosphate hydrolase
LSKPKQYFRAAAGAVIVNSKGQVLAVERMDVADAWQLPQGGLETTEAPERAAVREAVEEAGIRARDLQLIAACSELLAYELPPQLRTKKTGRGQVLYWFLFKYRGPAELPAVVPNREIRNRQWMTFSRMMQKTAPFRRAMYKRLAIEFKDYLRRT